VRTLAHVQAKFACGAAPTKAAGVASGRITHRFGASPLPKKRYLRSMNCPEQRASTGKACRRVETSG
jgi:hypothetical protein